MVHLKKRYKGGDNLYLENLSVVALAYLDRFMYCKLITVKVLLES